MNANPLGLFQRIGQFPKRNIRFRLHKFREKDDVSGQLTKLSGGSALKLGDGLATLSMFSTITNCRRRADTKDLTC